MGNEAADADSIISSLTFSFLLHESSNTSNNDANDESNLYLPLISIPKEDIALRRDATLLLECCQISIDKLLYLDPPTITSISTSEDLNMLLTDHNAIRQELQNFSQNVTMILDHHQDEHQHKHLSLPSNRIIAFHNGKALVGSTCTLIVEQMREMRKNHHTFTLNWEIAIMLLGTILVDTVNQSQTAGKVTDRDRKVIQYLLQETDWTLFHSTYPQLFDRNETTTIQPNTTLVYNWLSNAKFDIKFWKKLSGHDCLRIDYKNFIASSPKASISKVGLSSILLPLDDFMSKSDLISSMESFMQKHQISLLGVMSCIIENDTPIRSMVFFSKDLFLMKSLEKFFMENTQASSLECHKQDSSVKIGEFHVQTFAQGNPKGSRKQVAPILLEFLNQN